MKRTTLSLSLFLLFAGCAVSQPSRVQIIIGATAIGATPPISTLGAIGHQVVLVASNASAHTCTTPNINGQLEFSFDNATWFPFGAPQGQPAVATSLTAIFLGASSFDYVRFNLRGFDTTNCVINGWYLGSSVALLTSVTGNVPQAAFLKSSLTTPWVENPVFAGGVGNLGLKQPLLVCDAYAVTTVTTGATVVMATVQSGFTFRVCSVTLTSTTAATANLAQADTGTSCVTNRLSVGITYSLTASVLTVFMGSNLGQLFNLGAGKDLCLTGGVGTTTALVSYALTPY
jgi:hypothetical protein